MNFYDSIAYPFRTWQLFCLSPFILSAVPSPLPPKWQNIYFGIGCTSAIAAIILAIIFGTRDTIEHFSYDPWKIASVSVTFLITYFSALVTLIESIVQREEQKEFLRKIDEIDIFLAEKIGISIDFPSQQRRYKSRLIYRFLVYCPLYTIFSWVAFIAEPIVVTVMCICVNTLRLLIILRFQQFSILVDVIYQRYRLINEHIDRIYSHDLSRIPLKMDFVYVLHRDDVQENPPEIDKFQLIWHLREVTGLLHDASHQLNGAFTVSYTACILNDFLGSILNNYFCLEAAARTGHFLVIAMTFVQSIPRFDNILSMAHVCENAIEESKKFKGCVHKLSFDSADNRLSRLVSGLRRCF